MKKIVLFISAGIIISSSFTSCKKSYTCECINTTGKESTSTIIATNRTEAQKNCDEKGLLGHCKIK